MIKVVYHREDELCTIAEIPIPSSMIDKTRRILSLHGVPQMGHEGGHGWIQGEGAIQITGSHKAVVKVTDAILKMLNGGVFRTGLELYERQKQGAMP